MTENNTNQNPEQQPLGQNPNNQQQFPPKGENPENEVQIQSNFQDDTVVLNQPSLANPSFSPQKQSQDAFGQAPQQEAEQPLFRQNPSPEQEMPLQPDIPLPVETPEPANAPMHGHDVLMQPCTPPVPDAPQIIEQHNAQVHQGQPMHGQQPIPQAPGQMPPLPQQPLQQPQMPAQPAAPIMPAAPGQMPPLPPLPVQSAPGQMPPLPAQPQPAAPVPAQPAPQQPADQAVAPAPENPEGQPAPLAVPGQKPEQKPLTKDEKIMKRNRVIAVVALVVFIIAYIIIYNVKKYKIETENEARRAKAAEEARARNQLLDNQLFELPNDPAPSAGKNLGVRLEYKGSAEFKKGAQQAIELLWDYNNALYQDLKQYVYVISQGSKSEFREVNGIPTIFLTEPTATRSPSWAAGEIAHMFFHARNHYELAKQKSRSGIPPGLQPTTTQVQTTSGYTPIEVDNSNVDSIEAFEKRADEFQVQTLIILGAPMVEIERIRNRKPGDYSLTHDGF